MPDRSPTHTAATQADLAVRRDKALTLIRNQRTMVLATALDQYPWTAPVYYVYRPPGFYFFSSPQSLHIQQARAHPLSAAAIYADGDDIEDIEGIQMSGRIRQVTKHSRQLEVTARFLTKFPLAKPLLTGDTGAVANLKGKVSLYCFSPEQVYYMDNRTGFGKRYAIDLSRQP